MRLPIKLSLRKYLSEQKGSALVMVLLATVGVTALTLVVIQARKNGASIATRSKADRDVERAVSLITTLLITPASCSANFAGKPLGNSIMGVNFINYKTLKKCNGGTECDAINFYDSTNPNWVMFSGETASKARIVAISYYQIQPNGAQTTGPSHAPAQYYMKIKFEKNLGMNNGTITSSFKKFSIDFPLVTGILDTTHLTLAPATTIVGCPRSASSTIAY